MTEPYGATEGAAGYGGNNQIPPTSAVNASGGPQRRPGTIVGGKVEHAVGAMIGSNELKAKGLQKEQ